MLYDDPAASQNADSTTGASSTHLTDFYRWYASIEHEEGVYLAHTEHYDATSLINLSGAYSTVPTQPFWYFTASPSYLQSQGFPVEQSLIDRAEQGEAVYLIPSTMSRSERNRMRGYLTESALQHKAWTSGISTPFMRQGVVTVHTYQPQTPLFTWTDNTELTNETTTPVIRLTTAANMTPFERKASTPPD